MDRQDYYLGVKDYLDHHDSYYHSLSYPEQASLIILCLCKKKPEREYKSISLKKQRAYKQFEQEKENMDKHFKGAKNMPINYIIGKSIIL